MPKRRSSLDDKDDSSIPLPIQTFLWRQTSPFIKPKLTKQGEAAQIEQREACKSFEKVLVQNIVFGLSPSLTEAIKSITRWRMIQVSLPHVMHCAAALLYNRKNSNLDPNIYKLGAAETKLLYTLHWILLDAAEECADAELEEGVIRDPDHYLLPVTTIELFIYLFSPLIPYLRQSDFLTSFRLENGYKIWLPLFNFVHPDIPSFSTQVKPKRDILRATRHEKRTRTFGDVFLGGNSFDRDEAQMAQELACASPAASFDAPPTPATQFQSPVPKDESQDSDTKKTRIHGTRDTKFSNSQVLSDPTMATYLDVATIRCLFAAQWQEEGVHWALKFLNTRLQDLKKDLHKRDEQRPRSNSLPLIDKLDSTERINDKKSDETGSERLGIGASSSRRVSSQDFRRSSFSGGLLFLGDRRGSEKIQPPIKKTCGGSFRLADKAKDQKGVSPLEIDFSAISAIAKWKRRIERFTSSDMAAPPPRCKSVLGIRDDKELKMRSKDSKPEHHGSGSSLLEMMRGKSMPADLHILTDKQQSEETESNKSIANSIDIRSPKKSSATMHSLANPIITITEHSPVASVQFFINNESESPREDSPPHALFSPPTGQPAISRSQSDSKISYYHDAMPEAPGTIHYISKTGQISLVVLLKAIHWTAMREEACSVRVCQEIVGMINRLLSLGIIPQFTGNYDPEIAGGAATPGTASTPGAAVVEAVKKPSTDELTIHNMMVDTMIRLLKHLACPWGCNVGARDTRSDPLRRDIRNCLLSLYKLNEAQFNRYMIDMVKYRSHHEILDILHGFTGFCVENPVRAEKRRAHLYGSQSQGPNPQDDQSSPQTGYVNNFGAGFGKIGPKGIEGVIINLIFRPFVSRMMRMQKELKSQSNMSLYCEIRQFFSYVRENHGGVFRCVALSGIMDATIKMYRKGYSPHQYRTADANQEPEGRSLHSPILDEREERPDIKKPIFKKKSYAGLKKATSNQSITDEGLPVAQDWSLGFPGGTAPGMFPKAPRGASPRLSIATTDEETATLLLQKTPKAKGFPFFNWVKGAGDKGKAGVEALHPEAAHMTDSNAGGYTYDSYPGTEKLARRASFQTRPLPKGQIPNSSQVGPKTSHVGLTFSKARKRMEDQFKIVFGKSKGKHGSFEENLDMSRRNSVMELDAGFKDNSLLMIREAHLVPLPAIRNGMMRFSFLLDSCAPGTLPDPPMIAAMIDLKAPVIARAAFFLECAAFVHKCNRGQWPSWMKLHIPLMRPSGPAKSGSASMIRGKQSCAMHRAAGRMFYQWAEALGARLEELLQNEINAIMNQESASGYQNGIEDKRELRDMEEEEDFLDDSTVNPGGNSSPFALKMAACQLLYEVTTFLRETHTYFPARQSVHSIRGDRPEKVIHEVKGAASANRRWSLALSSLGVSQTSAHSLMSLADPQAVATAPQPPPHPPQPSGPGERRISFVLHEADGESHHSSNTTLTQEKEDQAKISVDPELMRSQQKRLSQSSAVPAQQRPHLLRRATGGGSGSFKRRSIKLKRPKGDRLQNKRRSSGVGLGDDDDEMLIRRGDSIRSRRKVSGISEKSDTSDRQDISGDESPAILSDDGIFDAPSDNLDADDSEIVRNMPWFKTVVSMLQNLDYNCNHEYACTMKCYRRQIRSCSRLVKAVSKIYEEEPHENQVDTILKLSEDKDDVMKREKKLKKIITGPTSPLRRKVSLGHMDKYYVDREPTHYGPHSINSSTTFLAQTHVDVEAGYHAEPLDPRKAFVDAIKSGKKKKEDAPSLKYVKNHVKTMFQSSLSMMVKGALILPNFIAQQTLHLSWELLLEIDQQVSISAGVSFILCALQCPSETSDLLTHEFSSEDTCQRLRAINKFLVLWRCRYQVWQRMEEGAHFHYKIPPPAIEFTLPSPKIALDKQPVVDPPWMPKVKSKVEEVTISQEQTLQRSFVTATKTRRKQQIELVNRALQEEEDKVREERENYRISSVPMTHQAAYEPAMFLTTEGPDEETEDDIVVEKQTHHLQMAQAVFPTTLCTAAVSIINLLDDPQVGTEGDAVYGVAYKVIWSCLVEDTALFLRHFLEKLTRESQDRIFQVLRRLIRFMPRLPAQAAYTLYNYLVGFIMFYVRAPNEASQELIGSAMSVMWLIVPSVHGLFLKDLKQILRKEQCDATLLITANVPSTKKIIVHGPDASGIPSQFPIHEDTQFSQILIDSLDFFGIEESEANEYFLVDAKTNQIHNMNAFVRDFYFFKRSQYPQLQLLKMDPDEAFEKLQKQALVLQFEELGKVLMSLSIVKSQYLAIQRVLFLHEELMKLPSFPRKALEANFGLYTGSMGKDILGMDTLHKMVWVRLVARMFEVTSGFFAQSSDIHLFINVVNGALILHCEDAAVLRLCMATYINAAHQFKNIFSNNGFLLIMPTLTRIYSNHQTNSLLCRTIEFVCKQFYILHRKPFVLQMFGSIAPILDMDMSSAIGDASRVQPKAFFQLLQSLGQYIADPLDILELVDAEKPLKALDFCYQMDPETFTVLDAVSLCVTVVAYAADSRRATQMLIILEAILPLHLKHQQSLTTKKETPGGPRAELQMIHSISICMRTLVINCEPLTRAFTGPQKAIDLRGSSIKNVSKGACSPPFEVDEDSHSKYVPEYNYPSRTRYNYDDDEDGEAMRLEFRQPRDTLLNIVAEFLTRSTGRLADLSKKLPELHQKGSSHELLDVKCHLRLAEVAHSLLKMAPYDPLTMACRGLVRYMNEVLPNSEWRQEAMRPALIMVLRRLDKTFNKIAKKSAMKRSTDWEAARRLLKGVYLTFVKHPYIVHLPHLKSLISVCQNIVLGEVGSTPSITGGGADTGGLPTWAAALSHSSPPGFCSVSVRLIAMQILQLGDSQTLESICGNAFQAADKTEIYLMNLVYPMCIRISSGVKDTPKLRQVDINFILSVILSTLIPSTSKSKMGIDAAALLANPTLQTSLQQIGFLGLKIMIICFEKQLACEWHRVAKCIRDMASKMQGGLNLWDFLDFVVTYRTPLFILLFPLIKFKFLNKICNDDQEYAYQQSIRNKMMGIGLPENRSRGQLFTNLMLELKMLKEELINQKSGDRKKSVRDSEKGHRLSFAAQLSRGFTRENASTASNVTPPSSDHQVEPQHKPPLLRGLSFRTSVRERRTLPPRGLSVKLPSHAKDGEGPRGQRFLRRTSCPQQIDEDDGHQDHPMTAEEKAAHASSEPKLFRKSTLILKKRGSKKSQGGSGPTSTEQLAVPGSEQDDASELARMIERRPSGSLTTSPNASKPDSPEDERSKYRLQRQKHQSRKTFRFRKSRRGDRYREHGDDQDDILEEARVESSPQPEQLPQDQGQEAIMSEIAAKAADGAVKEEVEDDSTTDSLTVGESSLLLSRDMTQPKEPLQPALATSFPYMDEDHSNSSSKS